LLFNTVEYAWFFAVAFVGSWALALFARRGRVAPTPAGSGSAHRTEAAENPPAAIPYAALPRVIFLLVLSYGFYAAWDWRYLPLIFGSSTVDFFLGRLIDREQRPAARRALLAATIALNLGFLGFFKYTEFVLESVRALESAVSGAPLAPREALRLLPPVGISFFTFESMSYVIDVYRRDLPAHRSYLRYLLFVSFFPHLVAGPIVRPRDLLPQLAAEPTLTRAQGSEGLWLVAIGLLKKVVISDQLAVNLVDRVFQRPENFSALETLAGVYGYAVQIYCDFSGYTDIAIGSALLLGVRFQQNFDAPYTAQSLADFWRRWHISLSTWLRDYLYIPLGGNRASELRTYRNLMLTMVLGGLWHGAAWTFVFWGFLHGMGLAISRALSRARAGSGHVSTALALCAVFAATAILVARLLARLMPADAHGPLVVFTAAVIGCIVLSAASALCEGRGRVLRAVAVVLTFHFVCVGWVFFRAPTFAQASLVFRQIATLTTFRPNLPPVVIALLLIGIASHYVPARVHDGARRGFAGLPAVVQGVLLFGVAVVLHEAASATAVPFVYFQF
jgi:D-alanyl-lipoteichoic acid acyltransferase DltB (MBOAT superfamily)